MGIRWCGGAEATARDELVQMAAQGWGVAISSLVVSDGRITLAGEPAIFPISAAVANAVYDATGKRLREMPFLPERVRAAEPA